MTAWGKTERLECSDLNRPQAHASIRFKVGGAPDGRPATPVLMGSGDSTWSLYGKSVPEYATIQKRECSRAVHGIPQMPAPPRSVCSP
jgi:hypothetical protein